MGQLILNHFGKDLSGKTFAMWGLAFKPGTDDMREAPSSYIIKELCSRGAKVVAYDPVATETAKIENEGVQGISYKDKSFDVLENADALILVTEWREFREPDFDKMASMMNSKLIFDGRNQYDPKTMKDLGFEYFSVGR